MEFDAKQCISVSQNVILYVDCCSKYIEDMYQLTKSILKFNGIISTSDDVSGLNSELRTLPRSSINNVDKLSNVVVIIASQSPVKIAKVAEECRKLNVKYDHISNYTSNIDFGFLTALGYDHYIDYLGNDICYVGEYKSGILKLRKGGSNIDICRNNKIELTGKIDISEKLCLAIYGSNSLISIKHSSFINTEIQITTAGKIEIGECCMFSCGINLLQADQHLIFDLETKERINKDKNICIGNHVWIGRGVNLLGGATIPDNCIVGTGSITSHKFTEANCIIAGNPAKVIRKNVVWARDNQAFDYQTYDECRDKVALKYIDD